MLTRSTLQIMVDLATQIDVPSQHVSEGFPLASLPPPAGEEAELKQLIKVKSGSDKPQKAFTAVKCVFDDHTMLAMVLLPSKSTLNIFSLPMAAQRYCHLLQGLKQQRCEI